MTEERVETDVVADRRSHLAVLLTRTPFDLLLRGRTVADLEAAVPAAAVPRGCALKLRGDELRLRRYGGPQPMATGWVVKARVQDTAEGVRLTGHQCYLADRIYFACFSAAALFLAGLAGWFALSEGPGSDAVLGCLAVAVMPGLLAVLVLVTQRGSLARQDARAREILRSVVDPD